jgi:hypothetical protein
MHANMYLAYGSIGIVGALMMQINLVIAVEV